MKKNIEINLHVLAVIKLYMEKNQDLRFHQILQALAVNEMAFTNGGVLAIKDDFYLDQETFKKRVEDRYASLLKSNV